MPPRDPESQRDAAREAPAPATATDPKHDGTRLSIGRMLIASQSIAVLAILTLTLFALRTTSEFRSGWVQLHTQTSKKLELLERFEHAVGYGGMIHNLKNFVLRHEERYAEAFWDDVATSNSVLDEYRGIPDITSGEAVALDELTSLVAAYARSMQRVHDLTSPIREVDRAAKVDDTPYIAAMEALRRGVRAEHRRAAAVLTSSLADARRTMLMLSGVGIGTMLGVGTPLLLGVGRRIRRYVAERARREAVLWRSARTDPLTGLANRTGLLERLEASLARSQRTGTVTAVLFFDFDHFKLVNDSLGHDAGDALLLAIAGRLGQNTRDTDMAARFGGDEFVVLLEDLESEEDALETAEQLLRVCARPHSLEGHDIVSTASIGLVTSALGYTDPGAMIRDADAAMYQAKVAGRGRVTVFDVAMHHAALDRLSLEVDLRRAVELRQLHLVYQPIVELEGGTIVGVEALCRWTHHERGSISPETFIRIAEDANIIHDLGEWVNETACAQLADWRSRGVVGPEFRVSVNASKAQLLRPGFDQRFLDQLRHHGLDTSAVKLEVTETTIVDNRSDIADTLRDLQTQGVTVVMDDFGTGHSSLSGLDSLPVDELKIDQSFVRRAEANKEMIAILTAIATLATHLSLEAVGEGIETPEHMSLLQSIGCAYGQGYLFSRPLQPDQLEEYLRGRGPAARALCVIMHGTRSP